MVRRIGEAYQIPDDAMLFNIDNDLFVAEKPSVNGFVTIPFSCLLCSNVM